MLRFEPLGPDHDRNGFDSGVDALDRYLRQFARQHVDKGIARTWVLVDEGASAPKAVLGFFTISICQVVGQDVPAPWARKLPREIPAMRLGRLAVAKPRKGEGLGKVLLFEAIRRAVAVAEVAGGIGLVVDAKDESAAAFYAHFGFVAAPGRPLTLFLPMATMRTLVGG